MIWKKVFWEPKVGFVRIWLLLNLTKCSRPDIGNATWELSKVIDGANKAVFLKMHHVIKYVLATKNLGLKLDPNGNEKEPWDIVCFCESNYVGDLVMIKSISGFLLYILCVLVSWRSKAQRSIILSSSETNWVALLQDVQEVMFVIQLPRT